MPLLDIAIAQASLQKNLGALRVQTLIHCKALSSPFSYGEEKNLFKSFKFPKRLNAHERGKLSIKAVATLEPKCLVQKEGGHTQLPLAVQVESCGADSGELNEREKLRRMRISKANKGNTPWNKGRKHSPETRKLIRERTRLAMQDPKIKMKLANLGHSQSEETRIKIGVGVRIGWKKRREKLMVQETCYYEWQNLIADASRKGYVGEEELQWDSYKILSEKLELEWLQSIEERKMMPRLKGSKRAPKSPEQKRKIAEAIIAKWADPDYRERVCSGLAKYHGTPEGGEGKPRRKASGGTQRSRRDPTKKKTRDAENSLGSDSAVQRIRLRRSKTPVFKDPLASSKLEMIKNIRAERAANETKKTEAVERARLLITEAQKAAKALEVAASKSPIARASLLETRKLIAEAIQSIESIDMGPIMSDWNDDLLCPESAPAEPDSNMESESDVGRQDFSQSDLRELNGTSIIPASSADVDLNFTKLNFHDMLNAEEGSLLQTASGSYGLASFDLEGLIKHSSSSKQVRQSEAKGNVESDDSGGLQNDSTVECMTEEAVPSTKKWVRGRLVEVTEE